MKNSLAILVVLGFLGRPALAGGASTGGGGAYVCRDRHTNAVLNAELMDLWEGLHIDRLNIPYSDEPVEVQLDRALTKLAKVNPGLADLVRGEMTGIQAGKLILPHGVSLPPPNDADNEYVKTDCPLEGMMRYDGGLGSLVVDDSIFSALMNNTNIAAAWMHEAIYKILRDKMQHKNSRKARKFTACLFSTNECFGVRFAVPINDKTFETYLCAHDDFEFFIFRERGYLTYDVAYKRMGSHVFDSPLYQHGGKLEGVLWKFGYVDATAALAGGPTLELHREDGSAFAGMAAWKFTFTATGEIVQLIKDSVCRPFDGQP